MNEGPQVIRSDRLCRRGASMKNLAHSASFDPEDKDAPSKRGIRQRLLDSDRTHRHVAAERVAGLLFGDGRKCKTGPSARIRQNHGELPSGLLDTIVDRVEISEVA